MPALIYEYTYGFKVDGDRKHASLLLRKNDVRIGKLLNSVSSRATVS